MPVGISSKKRPIIIDIILFILLFGLVYSLLHLAKHMVAPYDFKANQKIVINLSPINLPYYTGLSVMRMFIAFGASILFTLVYGYIAAKNKTAEKIMIPLLDILQSVPVLGFLSVTVIAFMAIFPGNLFGIELASIFAIFTAQAWNMTFSFYNSLSTLPKELEEAATMLKLNWWQRLIKLELPYSMIGLVWNGMMSFGGAWFFLAASEAVTVLNRHILLPGIGSYVAEAIMQGKVMDILLAVVAMILTILLIDFLFWKPVVLWSQKFKVESTASTTLPTSLVYDVVIKSQFFKKFISYVIFPTKIIGFCFNSLAKYSYKQNEKRKINFISLVLKIVLVILSAYIIVFSLKYAIECYKLFAQVSVKGYITVFSYGFYTMLRVLAAVFLGALWTIPVGVKIGLNPKLAKICQPLVQVAASFPANILFPFITILFLKFSIGLSIGAIPLMMLGTQWYILFNVIAGAMAIPSDLLEAGDIFKLTGLSKWRKLIIPSIFPALITGAITASGGAWNASIIAELVTWKTHILTAKGLGMYIDEATRTGNWTHIILGIVVMSIFVVIINNILWRRLYNLAKKKYSL